MTFYNRDDSLPFWRANVDVDALYENHAHRPDCAQAWLRYRDVSESCSGFQQAAMMRGHFEGGILCNHTYHWTFTPMLQISHAQRGWVFTSGIRALPS